MKDNGCVVGGEGNGGVIDPRTCYTRDSLSGMALTLEMMAREGKSISARRRGASRRTPCAR